MRSGNIQGAFREHRGSVQGTLREHWGNVPGTFRAHSGKIETLREHSHYLAQRHGHEDGVHAAGHGRRTRVGAQTHQLQLPAHTAHKNVGYGEYTSHTANRVSEAGNIPGVWPIGARPMSSSSLHTPKTT
jgi:hypothetical protein